MTNQTWDSFLNQTWDDVLTNSKILEAAVLKEKDTPNIRYFFKELIKILRKGYEDGYFDNIENIPETIIETVKTKYYLIIDQLDIANILKIIDQLDIVNILKKADVNILIKIIKLIKFINDQIND